MINTTDGAADEFGRAMASLAALHAGERLGCTDLDLITDLLVTGHPSSAAAWVITDARRKGEIDDTGHAAANVDRRLSALASVAGNRAKLGHVLSEISDWEEDRAELSERENSVDDRVDPDEWALSDDAAVELLRQLADAVRVDCDQLSTL